MLSEFSQLVLTLYRGCREQPVDRYQQWAFDQVRPALCFDSGVWLTGALDSERMATVHTIQVFNLPARVAQEWAMVVSQGRAVLTEQVFRVPGITFNCAVAREFGPELQAYVRACKIEYILATGSLDPVSRLSEVISLYRADPLHPFSEQERLLQQSIVPHLVETWRINRAHHMNLPEEPFGHGAASAVTDHRGVLHLIAPGFAGLLLTEWPGWEGPSVPRELMRAVERHEKYSGKVLVARAEQMGEFVMLRVRSRILLDTLSQRERDVANFYACGSTYREIAKQLNLSPATVRNHLNNIYSKLGVSSKAELIAALVGED